jgi:hypothetical protein
LIIFDRRRDSTSSFPVAFGRKHLSIAIFMALKKKMLKIKPITNALAAWSMKKEVFWMAVF